MLGGLPAPTRFEVLRRLGEGGMGVVYEARDRERGTRVALKTLRNFTANALIRFKHEFRALQDLHHPNLVMLGELISEGDEWFFTMELVDGCDFIAYVREDGSVRRRGDRMASLETTAASNGSIRPVARISSVPPRAPARTNDEGSAGSFFDERRLRTAIHQLAEGLHALHSAGLVHRDIKPSNIRVTRDDRVVLLDFGLVAEVDRGDRSTAHHIVGTPAYMAPEQATGTAIGPEADWYGVGVLLYEAMTGVLPFSGSSLDILLQKQREQPPPPSSLSKTIPPDLDALCAALLRFDPSERPTKRDISQIVGVSETRPRAAASVHAMATQDTPFVGRARELDTLRGALEDAKSTQAVAVVLSGESGVGKTCLVRHFVDAMRAGDAEALILMGRCYERESVPYKAFDGVVDTLARALARWPEAEAGGMLPMRVAQLVQVFPVLQRVPSIERFVREPPRAIDPIELRNRAFTALRELLTRIADRRTLIVVIDDAQWADDDSRLLLSEVLRPPDAPRLLLIATVRTSNADSTFTRRRGDDLAAMLPCDTRLVDLTPLSENEGRELALRLLERTEHAADVDVNAIAREAEGHPLFIDALVRHGATKHMAGGPRVRLENALWARIEPLQDEARSILELLAVAGAPIAQDVLAKACEIDSAELSRRIAVLRVGHLLQTAGARGSDAIDVYHDRIRGAVLSHLVPSDRKALHRRLAIALESEGGGAANAEAIANHCRAAGELGQAARYALIAADHAASILAFDRAVRLYQLALSLRDHPGEERRKLHAKLGDALSNAGRGAPAAHAFHVAAEGAPEAEALDLRRRAAEQLLRAGHLDEGLAAIHRVLAAIGERLPGSPFIAFLLLLLRRAHLRLRGISFRERDTSQIPPSELVRIDVFWSIASSLSLTDNITGALFQARQLNLALHAGEPMRVARALSLELGFLARGGSSAWPRVEALIVRATELAERTQRPEAIGFAWAAAGFAHHLCGKFRRGVELLDRGLQIMRDESTGMAWEIAAGQWNVLSALSMLGELKEVARRRPHYVREALDPVRVRESARRPRQRGASRGGQSRRSARGGE